MDADAQARTKRATEQVQLDAWASRDVSQLDVTITMVAELLCESIGLRPGQAVLDVATGSGNPALAAARRGCEPRGIDRLPALLERARERARAERLRAHFQLGDAEAIPFPDASFDVVLSVFGFMFSPNLGRAVEELLRVCRSGGTIGLANWAAEGFVGAVFHGIAQHDPPGTELAEPAAWGTEQGIRALFGERVRHLEVSQRSFTFRCRSPESFLQLFQTYYSPILSQFQQLEGPGRDALARTLITVVEHFNRADDGTVIVPADYLEVFAIKR